MLIPALQYAASGWYVIPLHNPVQGRCSCGAANCTAIGKHPRVKDWPNLASKDPSVISAWWGQWPNANVGLVTGAASGFIVLDIDPLHGGDDSLADLAQQHGRLPDTIECLTGGGGRHLYFRHPGKKVKNSVSSLGPGLDIRGDGGYVVAPPSLHKTGNLYEWEASSDPNTSTLADVPGWMLPLILAPAQQQAAGQPGHKIMAGNRNKALFSKGCAMRAVGLTVAEIEAALLVMNRTQCDPPLLDDEVKVIAASTGRYAPRVVPTDDDLAEEWLNQYPETAYGLGEFRRYSAGCWPIVPYNQVEAEILKIAQAFAQRGYKISAWKIKSAIELARIRVQVSNDQWDADPEIVVCKNGTLHIPSGQLRAHSQSDYVTGGLAFDYDVMAEAPTWSYYLHTTINGVSNFLQEFSGYCLTTDTRYEVAVWLYGQPGTGKSTFIEGIRTMLGGKVGNLGLTDIERSRFGLSDLPNKTLLVSTEQPAIFMQASNILNSIISGESVTVDRKFRDAITITPRAKILWAMNELPRVPDASNGLFRRVKVVMFGSLPCAKDPAIKENIKREGSGILNWALSGLARLQANGGFDFPAEVIDATDYFKQVNDIPFLFVEECCVRETQAKIRGSELYGAYRTWCSDNGHRAQSSTSLAEDWQRLGFIKVHTKTGSFWEGIRLK